MLGFHSACWIILHDDWQLSLVLVNEKNMLVLFPEKICHLSIIFKCTQLCNRGHLPTIVGQNLQHSTARNSPFCFYEDSVKL